MDPKLQAEIDAIMARAPKPQPNMGPGINMSRANKADPWARPQPNISGIDMSRVMKPRYTAQGGMAIDPVSPYLAYRAIKGRRG